MAEERQGERTEEPTPRQLAQARRRGEVAYSRDLTGGVASAAVFAVLACGAAAGVGQLIGYFRGVMAGTSGESSLVPALAAGLRQAGAALALPLGLAALAAALAGVAQTGGLLTFSPVR